MTVQRNWRWQVTINITTGPSEETYSCFMPVDAKTASEAFDKALAVVKKDRGRLPDKVTIKRSNSFSI